MKKPKLSRIMIVIILIVTMIVSIQPNYAYASEGSNETVRITYTAGTGGSVSNSTEQFLLKDAGSLKGSTAIPSEGWNFSHWESGDGSTVSTEAQFVPDIPTAAAVYSYKAIFREIPVVPESKIQDDQAEASEVDVTAEDRQPEAVKTDDEESPTDGNTESDEAIKTEDNTSESEPQDKDMSAGEEKKESKTEEASAADKVDPEPAAQDEKAIETDNKEQTTQEEESGGPGKTDNASDDKPEEDAQKTETEGQPEDADKDPSGEWLFDEQLGNIRVTVKADRAAFPEGTTMKLAPVNSDSAAEAVMEATDMLVKEIAAVDITFLDSAGKEIKPAEPVNVTISSSVISRNSDPVVIHIDDTGACDKPAILEETDHSVTIETKDFSVYAVAYTVDFHYEGLTFSISGKSSIMLSDLLRELGIELDLSFVESVSFSDSDLVRITKADNDWLLTSLNPFASNENLRILLINGSEINIAVTDAQDASAYFHAEITSNKDTYASGSTALYSVKYTIDRENIHEGDYIYVTIPSDIISSADLSVSSQHFSSVENLGNGQYKLTFGAGAESALAGSFSMFLTTAEVEEQQTGPITVGNDSSSITVSPKGPSGTGVYTDTIHKDAADNGSAVMYGDYDYSEGYGDSAAQIGILTSYPGSIKYRLYVNNKEGEINNVVVTDVLPDGMVFDFSKPVEVSDRNTGHVVDPSLYNVTLSGNTLTFSYPGTLTTALQINYWVNLISAKPLAGKYTNRADITYEQGGTPYAEHRNYILQGSDYSAANGEKSVDKTEISTDPDDQLVTYTIKFWNQNGFSTGEIELDDILDPYVHFISASTIEYFSITQDENDPQIIHLENIEDISGTTTVYVRFICDFSDVPVGYTVENILGGNITKTQKIGGSAVISAGKTVDDNTPTSDQVFDFELLDQAGSVLQTKQNEGADITFDAISYGKEDLGKTFTYQIREKADQDTDYVIDDSVYTVTVTVASEADEDGIIDTTVTYQKDGVAVDEAAFNNTSAQIEIPVTKAWEDSENQDGIRPNEVTVKLLAGGEDTGKTLVLNEGNHWTDSFTELDQYSGGNEIVYTIEEVGITGYTAVITGTQAEGYTVTNSHTPETTEVSGSKTWNDSDDQDGARPESITIRLLADGTEVDSRTVTADDEWKWTFTNLPKNKEGKAITYSITEDATNEYASEVTGYNVTNTHTPGETSLTVKKVWNDDRNKDGLRPASISVQLLKNGAVSGREDAEVELNAENNWTYTWNHLPEKESGKAIEYSVDEKGTVDGYSKVITGDMKKGYTITNTHTPSGPKSGYKAIKSSDTANQEVKPGDQITYKITIQNTGDTKLTGIWIRDYIPEYTKFVSAGQNGERGAINGKQHVDWFISALDAGQSTQVTFTVEVVTCIPDNTIIRNTAYTEDTENPEKPSLNKPDNPKDKTNEIVHYYKPDKSINTRGIGPKTGDDTNITGYILIMLLSGLAAILLARRKKRI